MTTLISDYNGYLILLSIAIAGLAAYTTLDLVNQVTITSGRPRIIWLLSGAITMGTGIWSMHFIGMLALQMPMTVRYDVYAVLLSVLPAILASGLSLWCVSKAEIGIKRLTVSSLLLASGIVAMHYVGMAAMRLNAVIRYSPKLVASSILIAIAVAWVGLYLAIALRREKAVPILWQKMLAACIMGAAIPIMHYTGMAAAQFIPLDAQYQSETLQSADNALTLTVAITIGSAVLLGLTVLTAVYERRLSVQALYTKAIQESQEYLQSILQGVQVGVVVVEGKHRIKVSNQAVLELLNLSTEAELQTIWQRAVQSNDQCQANQPDKHTGGKILEQQMRSLRPILRQAASHLPLQNAIVYLDAEAKAKTALLVNAVSLASDKSDASQTIYTFSDISEQKQIEASLQKSEIHARTLASQETLFSQIANRIRRSLNLSDTLQTAVCEVRKFFNTDRALIYQFDAHWQGKVVWEDVAEPWLPTLGQFADNCFPETCLERYRNGHIRTIDNVANERLSPEHQEFLQKLQVKANLIVPIMVSDRLWGLLIIHQCDKPRSWAEFEGKLLHRLAIQLGIAIQQAELYAQAEQNAVRAQLQTEQLKASEKELRQQVEARQKALQELQQLQMQLVQSEKMSLLGQLVAGVAHEINNPVNFVHGNIAYVKNYSQDLFRLLQLYQTHYPNPDSAIEEELESIELEFLQKDLPKTLMSMQNGTERIRQIVLSLQNFSRMDEADVKEVDIHEGIDSTLQILQHRLNKKAGVSQINIIRNYTEVPKITCHPGKLNQVFMNILSNAIDALESVDDNQVYPREITIQTSLISDNASFNQHHQLDKDLVQIEIANNGPSIPIHIQERIFEPFFTTKPAGKGTGLGMSISHQIITELHNGQLKCISNANNITKFLIQLPLRVSDIQRNRTSTD
ncbi:MAG: MHYT domain-containing protein [Cyanobacteria bacterium P01_F01_bin.150]